MQCYAFTMPKQYILKFKSEEFEEDSVILEQLYADELNNVDDFNGTKWLLEDIKEALLPKVKDAIQFQLFTRSNSEKFEVLHYNNVVGFKESSFDQNRPTIFVTHGWRGSSSSSSCILIKDALLKKGDYNVIIVEWSSISKLLYLIAQSYVREVALEVALMIKYLESNGMKLENTTLIGHSLGAHVMGITGFNLKGRIDYIVGLDPAGPFFLDRGPGQRISSADAYYVEVLHTNAGLLGLRDAVGDRDFFPNGGLVQAGCKFPYTAVCSHSRSYEIYVESLTNAFYGKKCDSYINYLKNQCLEDDIAMIGDLEFQSVGPTGSFYFKTNKESPFSRGICGIDFGKRSNCTEKI